MGPKKKQKQHQHRRHLPESIHHEILTWLPVRSVARFRCVCKQWFSLISSDRRFQLDHYRRRQSRQNPPCLVLLLLKDDDRPADMLILDIGQGGEEVRTRYNMTISPDLGELKRKYVISCQGLFCIYNGAKDADILVGNPFTREITTLPRSQNHGGAGDGFQSCIGIGYVDSTQEFKVVRFSGPEKEIPKCEVFTLGTAGHWRDAMSPPFITSNSSPPFLHGVLHLLPQIDSDLPRQYWIAAFNIKSEAYTRMIPLPEYFCREEVISDTGVQRLTVVGGLLCLVYDTSVIKAELEVWLLKDYDSWRWEKEYVFDISTLYDGFCVLPLAKMGDDCMLLLNEDVDISKGRDQLVYYDCKENSILKNMPYDCSAVHYEETLFSLGK